jgi:mannose-6-phosphate isomerase-like protein (cupin superfamily)
VGFCRETWYPVHPNALDGRIKLGKGRYFHPPSRQEEVLYVLSGQVEQWIERENRILRPGRALFIPPVSFMRPSHWGGEARMLAMPEHWG